MTKRKEKPDAEPTIRGRATTPRKPNGQLVKGIGKPVGAGRAKGKRNRTTILLNDAIIRAAELVGEDGKGKGELVGTGRARGARPERCARGRRDR